MIKNCIVLFLTLLLITGCATNPKKIQAAYVSPLVYKDYDDEQIIMEMDHIGQRTAQLYNSLASEAGADTAQMAIGLVLFWPTLFFLEGGDGPEAAEYARLKGEYEALRKLAVQRKISLDDMPPAPEQIIKNKSPRKSKVKSALNENRRD